LPTEPRLKNGEKRDRHWVVAVSAAHLKVINAENGLRLRRSQEFQFISIFHADRLVIY
jgi:hypothetical protein